MCYSLSSEGSTRDVLEDLYSSNIGCILTPNYLKRHPLKLPLNHCNSIWDP